MAHDVREIGDSDFQEQIARGLTLVDFWAPWCGPCRMQLPILTSVAQRVGEQALIAKVNVDDSPITAQKFEVKSIPTLILFRDGEPIKRFVGVQTEPVLLSEIEAAAGTPAT